MDPKVYTILIGALVGWLLKMFFEYATGVQRRNRLARKAYFQLFVLLRQIESVIDGVEIFGLSEPKVTDENIDYWRRTLVIEDYDRIRTDCFEVLNELAGEAPKISARALELFGHVETLQKYQGLRPDDEPKEIAIDAPKVIAELFRETRTNLIELLDLLDKQGRSFRILKGFRDFDIGPEEPVMAQRMKAGIQQQRAEQE